MVSRRELLAGLGGITLVGVAGGTLFATTRTPHAALAPWQAPGTLATDPRVKAIEWAVLAPNPHNRQPWLVELIGEDKALLRCDLERRLPATDPFDRQILIGLGAFSELLIMAAQADGWNVTVTPFPDGAPSEAGRLDGRPIAHFKFSPGTGGTQDTLFSAVPLRRSHKEPFDDRGVTPATVTQIGTLAGAPLGSTVEDGKVRQLKDLCMESWLIESSTPRTHQESVDLMRIGKSEINANPDGIDLGGAFLETLAMAGLLTRQTLADPNSQAFASGKDIYEGLIGSAQGFIWSVTPTNTRAEQFRAGREWLRINLAATSLGVAVQPLSQALQEYGEMTEPLRKVHALLGVEEPARIQMLARIGYGPQVPPSPRWPAKTRII
ncbi:MAG: twin-arginine translocation pathway signal protein [Pseudomonadota bacterium]